MWKKTDKALATNIQNSLATLFPGEKNRGVKSAQYYVLNNTKVPAALVEVGFLSHDETAKKFNSYYYQNRLAEAIVNGILRTIV
jgi:N-acetylmuramoyl-L-alanine amidase